MTYVQNTVPTASELKINTANDFARLTDFNKTQNGLKINSNNLLVKDDNLYHPFSLLQLPDDIENVKNLGRKYTIFESGGEWNILDRRGLPAKWKNGEEIKFPNNAEFIEFNIGNKHISYRSDNVLHLFDKNGKEIKFPDNAENARAYITGHIFYKTDGRPVLNDAEGKPAKWATGKKIRLPNGVADFSVSSSGHIFYLSDIHSHLFDKNGKAIKLPEYTDYVTIYTDAGYIACHGVGIHTSLLDTRGKPAKWANGREIELPDDVSCLKLSSDGYIFYRSDGVPYLFDKHGAEMKIPFGTRYFSFYPTGHIEHALSDKYNILMPNFVDHAVKDADWLRYDRKTGQVSYLKEGKLFQMSLINPGRESVALKTAIKYQIADLGKLIKSSAELTIQTIQEKKRVTEYLETLYKEHKDLRTAVLKKLIADRKESQQVEYKKAAAENIAKLSGLINPGKHK